jgi:hypothetical protein
MTEVDTRTVQVFHSSRWKNVALVGFLLILVGAALVRAEREPDTSGWYWFGAAIAALLSVFFAIQAVRGLPTLTLTNQGVELITGFGNKTYYWSDFEGFASEGNCIRIWFSLTYRAGPKEGIFTNQYVATTDEIYQALTAWRKKFGQHA